MSEKYYGLTKWGWIFFAGHTILFNVLQGHENIFRFIGGLFGSYILTWILFAVINGIRKTSNEEIEIQEPLSEPE